MVRKKGKIKTAKVKPELPGGFRDYGPEDAMLRERLLGKIRKTFEDFGFDPVETPAVERTEVLLGGEKESGKIIFNIRGSKEKKSDASLRFDLTVPLARFVASNPEIPKPFRRYQIGKVWRGESPQAGRYREFTQADADIVGSSSAEADAEIVALAERIFTNIGIRNFKIKINSRKILNELPKYAGFPEKKLADVLRVIDKKDKIGEGGVKKELAKTVSKKAAEKIFEFLRGGAASAAAMNELREILKYLGFMGIGKDKVEVDYFTVRGLGYYTGMVFEAFLTKLPQIGSVASGGRYDALTVPFTGQVLPSVGFSVGADRLYAALDELGLLKKKKTAAKVLILNLDPDLTPEYFSLARRLREANLNTALWAGDDRAFQAQLAYAVKKEIPYVIIYGKREKASGVLTVKKLASREEKQIPKNKILEYVKK